MSDAAKALAEAVEQHRRDLLEPWPLNLTTGEVMDIKDGLSDAIEYVRHHQPEGNSESEKKATIERYRRVLYALDRRFIAGDLKRKP